MKQCSKCEQKMDGNVKFCRNCGTENKREEKKEIKLEAEHLVETENKENEKAPLWTWLAVPFGFFVGYFFGFIGAIFVFGGWWICTVVTKNQNLTKPAKIGICVGIGILTIFVYILVMILLYSFS